jgi:CRP-like cAMP-binding protein
MKKIATLNLPTREAPLPVRIGVLSHSRAFGSLPAGEMEKVASRSFYRRFRAREVLTQHGGVGDALIVVGRGRVKATLPSPDSDTEFVLGTFVAGDIIGEIAAIQNRPRVGGLAAITDAEVLLVPREELAALLERQPAVAARLLDDVCGKLRQTYELCLALSFLELPSRFYARLLYLSRIDSRRESDGIRINHGLSQKELAGSIGVSRESLNRLLGEWKSAGFIQYGRGFILVCDPAALANVLPAAIRAGAALGMPVDETRSTHRA